jgi:hypothetical protein
MTIKKLIKKLRELPETMEVYVLEYNKPRVVELQATDTELIIKPYGSVYYE